MDRKYVLANSILGAAAIIASAVLGAPGALTLLLLPGLAVMSLVTTSTAQRRSCVPASRGSS